jgi:hypothetical protein
MFRSAALSAGTNLDQLVRLRSARRLARPILIAGGLLATGTVVALAHVAGVDVRTWIAPGQSGLVPSLLETYTDQGSSPEAR